MNAALPWLLCAIALCACAQTRAEPPVPVPQSALATAKAGSVASSAMAQPAPSSVPTPAVHYAWLAEPSAPKSTDSLWARFPAPAGYKRIELATGSFGAFLRTLPLSPEGTPVVAYHGGVIHPATHPNVAAVVAIDVGKGDLQQCADSVIRLHAEWLFGKGRQDEHYHAAAGLDLGFPRYLEGDRLSYENGKLSLTKIAPKSEATHAGFRHWLDEVFGWANTASLAKEAAPITISEATAGDFFVMPGVPFGHAVLILDVARSDDGKRKVLLGQGYMPAQSFHVLRPSATETWFVVDEASGEMVTPFWKPFPFATLRRLGA
jgi:hypothetical protein